MVDLCVLYSRPPLVFRMEPQGVLYVRQKQWAVTYPGDRLDNGDKAGRSLHNLYILQNYSPVLKK